MVSDGFQYTCLLMTVTFLLAVSPISSKDNNHLHPELYVSIVTGVTTCALTSVLRALCSWNLVILGPRSLAGWQGLDSCHVFCVPCPRRTVLH